MTELYILYLVYFPVALSRHYTIKYYNIKHNTIKAPSFTRSMRYRHSDEAC